MGVAEKRGEISLGRNEEFRLNRSPYYLCDYSNRDIDLNTYDWINVVFVRAKTFSFLWEEREILFRKPRFPYRYKRKKNLAVIDKIL